MTKMFRHMAVAIAAAAALPAMAEEALIDFKTFYDTSTPFNWADTETLGYTVARLQLVDVIGGVKGTLSFYDTEFSASAKGLRIDELWLSGSDKGYVVRDSGAALKGSFYKRGFYKEGDRYNYDIDFKSAFGEGQKSTFLIKGANVSVDSFLTRDGDSVKGVMLEVSGVGKPYSGWLGLNSSVHFIGETVMIPEPSTYALMGIGLVGIMGVARSRRPLA